MLEKGFGFGSCNSERVDTEYADPCLFRLINQLLGSVWPEHQNASPYYSASSKVSLNAVHGYCSVRYGLRILHLGLAMKEMPHDSFAARLAALRRSRGLTHDQLGAAAAKSQRMIAHYENTP